ncbi:MAG: glycosyltransferase [Candidatus Eisenbacteria bacterium]
MRNPFHRAVLPLLLVGVDLLAMNLAFGSALFLRFHAYNLAVWAERFGHHYLYFLVFTNILYLILLLYYREPVFPRRFKPTFVVPRIAKMILIVMLASVMLLFLSKGFSRSSQAFHFSRPTLVAFWILSIVYLSVGRFAVGILQLYLFRTGRLARPVFILGQGSSLEDLEMRLAFNRWFGVRVAGKLTVHPEDLSPEPGGERLPDASALADRLRTAGVREVFLAVPPEDLKQVFAVLEAAARTGAKVRAVPHQLQMIVSHLLLSEALPVPDRTKEDLVYELIRRVDARFELELATVAVIGAKGIPPTWGGIERHVAELSNRLARRGFIVKVYARPYYTNIEGRFHGVEILRLPTIRTKHLDAISHSFLATLHTLLQRVDLAHYHAQGPSVLSFIPRLVGIRTVVTVHGLDWKREKWGAFARSCLRTAEAASARFPSRTITVSRTLKKYYEEKYGRPVTHIPNGIEVHQVPPPYEIVTEFGLRPRGFLLFVGRIVPEKGCHYLVEAFRRIKTDKELVIAGGSSFSDRYLEDLKKLAAGDERIRFLDYVYGRALEELYSHNYFYVLPSDVEGLAITLLEALSFGSCVLVSDIEENLEVLSDKEGAPDMWEDPAKTDGPPVGYWFRRGDVDDLVRALESLLADPGRVERARAKAREWIRHRYDWEVISARTASLYRDVVKK